jgi:hypothetical protein
MTGIITTYYGLQADRTAEIYHSLEGYSVVCREGSDIFSCVTAPSRADADAVAEEWTQCTKK